MSGPNVVDCCFLSIPKSGARLIWEVTQYCPFECEYCFTWSSPRREMLEVDIAQAIPRVKRLMDEINVSDVLITGGEPLVVAESLTPFLRYLSSTNISFSLSTNLPNENQFHVVTSFGPRAVNLSIDPPPSSALAKPRSSFKADLRWARKRLKILEDAGLKAKLTAVVSRANYNKVPVLLDSFSQLLAQHANVDKIAFNREYPIGYAADAQPQTQAELKTTHSLICNWAQNVTVPVSLVNWSEFHAPLQKCPAGSHIVSIQQNGDVTPCSLLYNITRSFRAGNLLKDPVDLIVDRLRRFARDLGEYYKKTEENTRACASCSHRLSCGGGCLAVLPIASNHIPRRTCQISPKRLKDHERSLLSSFHKEYHKVYTPEQKRFAVPSQDLDKALEKQIRDYVHKKLVPSDLAHTMEHIDCVVNLAKFISKAEGASQKITIPAAYFHDLAPREAAMHHMHTYKSAALARQFLERTKTFTSDEILHVQYCIITSSYGSHLLGYTPLSLEAKVVRDADWLDAIGARGIARVFAFGQAHGATEIGYPEHDPEGLPISVDMNITGPDGTPIYHFFTKLLRIYGLLETNAAKKLGEERHRLMVDFLRQYKREADLVSPGAQLVLPFNGLQSHPDENGECNNARSDEG